MAERFQPHPESEENDEQEELQVDDRSSRMARIMDRLFLRESEESDVETDDDEEDEESEEKSKKKKRRTLGKAFLAMIGLQKEDAGQEDSKAPSSNVSDKPVSSWLPGIESTQSLAAQETSEETTPEATDQSEEARVLDGDVVELPPPASVDVVETMEEDAAIEEEGTSEPITNSGETQAEREAPDDRLEEGETEEVFTEDIVVTPENPEGTSVDQAPETREQQEAEPATEERVVERSGSGPALAAFVAAEILDSHRNKKTREKLQEQMKKQKNDQEKQVDALLQEQQQIKQKGETEQQRREHLERRHKETKQQLHEQVEKQQKIETIVEKIRSEQKATLEPEIAPVPERQTGISAEIKTPQAHKEAQPVTEAATEVSPKSAELIRQQIEAAAELGVPVESYYERRHEVKDEPSAAHHASQARMVAEERIAAAAQELQNELTASQGQEDMLRQASRQAAQQLYKQAAISGATIAVVILAILFVIAILT